MLVVTTDISFCTLFFLLDIIAIVDAITTQISVINVIIAKIAYDDAVLLLLLSVLT